jgi:hypothetical protein
MMIGMSLIIKKTGHVWCPWHCVPSREYSSSIRCSLDIFSQGGHKMCDKVQMQLVREPK